MMPISRQTLRRGPRCRQKLRCRAAQRRMALMSTNPALLERGNVSLVRFDPVEGHEQGSDRPSVIVSGSPFNTHGRALVAIVPVSSRLSQHRLSIHRHPVAPGRGSPVADPRERDRSCSGERWHARTLATGTCASQAPTLSRGEAALMAAEDPAGISPVPAMWWSKRATNSASIACSRLASSVTSNAATSSAVRPWPAGRRQSHHPAPTPALRSSATPKYIAVRRSLRLPSARPSG